MKKNTKLVISILVFAVVTLGIGSMLPVKAIEPTEHSFGTATPQGPGFEYQVQGTPRYMKATGIIMRAWVEFGRHCIQFNDGRIYRFDQVDDDAWNGALLAAKDYQDGKREPRTILFHFDAGLPGFILDKVEHGSAGMHYGPEP
jgi:hypothetical protein